VGLCFQLGTYGKGFQQNTKNEGFMRQTLEERQAALQKKIDQIQARIELKSARQSEAARKLDTRRKIILGGHQLATLKGHSKGVVITYLKTVAATPSLREPERQVLRDWIRELEANS
jgi:hypothetical protein